MCLCSPQCSWGGCGSLWFCGAFGGVSGVSRVFCFISVLLLPCGCGSLCPGAGIPAFLHLYSLVTISERLVNFVAFVSQPSQIRFSCLPMSRVECMLKLPSLDLVFSSNRGELEPTSATHPPEGQNTPSSTPPSVHNANRVPGSKGMNCDLSSKTCSWVNILLIFPAKNCPKSFT